MNGSVLALLIGLALLALAVWLLWRAGTQNSTGAGSASFDSTPTASPDSESQLERAKRGVDTKKAPEEDETNPAASPGERPAESAARGANDGELTDVAALQRQAAERAARESTRGVEEQSGPLAAGTFAEASRSNSPVLGAGAGAETGTDTGAATNNEASAEAIAEANTRVGTGADAETNAEAGTETGTGSVASAAVSTVGRPAPGEAEKQIQRREDEDGFRFIRGRRKRRAWAHSNGFEHLREDSRTAQEMPDALLNAMQPEHVVLRDVVAGFFEGYEITIGDLGDSTVLRMRRPARSPVTVYYSVAGAVPAGMRRAELLDQPPFYGFTTDIRALDRMLDERVEDGLATLAHVVSDIVWEGEWIVVRMSRKLDMSVWEQVLPVVRTLADAAMVLPPLIMSTPLEMDSADPTRAWPHGVGADKNPTTVTNNSTEQRGEEAKTSEQPGAPAGAKPKTMKSGKTRPGHLRAVEDKQTTRSRREDQDEAGTDGAGSAGAADNPAGEERDRPHIERPAGPVEFPSRSTGRTEGDWDDEDFPLRDETDSSIPSLGEDPDHISGSHSQYARVIRVEQETSIFGDELSHAAQARRRRGRHRAPDARHARPEPIEAVEADIETVDGEIIEDGE
ncbi:hypothetical protein [uncultured Corynebacterium sp.]|uniref:hypothetical protein n=1 Tax=uncultured Corynebacterium sp. TaxID=159447 RepID=UPI0025CF192A|nr:hypothetical protein [uncultured Corynebacterium sp.]